MKTTLVAARNLRPGDTLLIGRAKRRHKVSAVGKMPESARLLFIRTTMGQGAQEWFDVLPSRLFTVEEPAPNSEAAAALARNLENARDELRKVSAHLDQLEKGSANRPDDWGYVGTAHRILCHLRQTLAV